MLALPRGDGTRCADILVRPEDVSLDAEGISCMVETSLYEGERYALRLALPDGQVLRAYSRVAAMPGETLAVAIRLAWRL
jgi:iron(III) transport system ATP-binding protein